MATLYADKHPSTGAVARARVGTNTIVSTFTLTAALVLNDVIKFCKIPKGACIVDLTLYSADVDTGGAPAITYNLGDTASAARFLSASTIGRTGGFVELSGMVAGVLGYTYTVDDTLQIVVAAGPQTGATSGTIVLAATYELVN